jgi:phosphate transport system protein
MRNLEERLDDIRDIVSETLKDCKRSLDVVGLIMEKGNFDDSLYGEVKSIEDRINHFELQIDDEVVKTIARFQPFAINLRFLIGVAKFSSQLERMSDLTLNILKVLKHSKNIEAYRGLNLIEMHAKVNHMFELFLKTYYQEELSYAYLILTLDEEVNSFKTQVIEATKASLRASTIEERDLDNLEALFISQHLERIGDTIKNLAEIAIYIYNGVDIRHNFVED